MCQMSSNLESPLLENRKQPLLLFLFVFHKVLLKIASERMNTCTCPQRACITFEEMCRNILRDKLCGGEYKCKGNLESKHGEVWGRKFLSKALKNEFA